MYRKQIKIKDSNPGEATLFVETYSTNVFIPEKF